MAKSLGQIHTVNFTRPIEASGNKLTCDLPGALTEQLNHMIRWGQSFKVCGIDMNLDTVGTVGGGQMTGYIRYYAPTKGRCAAVRNAFMTMKDTMSIMGIEMRDNKLYDFRAPINNSSSSPTFANQACLDGTNGLALRSTVEGSSIFGVHNRQQQPQYEGTSGDLFQPGFDTKIPNPTSDPDGGDFVLNDTVSWSGDSLVAELEYETIPFMITWSPDEGTGDNDVRLPAVNFQWRPDPALYLAVLCGQLQVVVEEVNFDADATDLNLNVAIHCAGWKSIMSNPERKRVYGKRKPRHKK